MTGPDFERIDQCIAWAAAHPDEHDQSVWGNRTPCGTTLCIAGRAALNWAPERVEWRRTGWEQDAVLTLEPICGTTDDPSEIAAEVLGLDGCEAGALFMAGDIWEVIEVRDGIGADYGAAPYAGPDPADPKAEGTPPAVVH